MAFLSGEEVRKIVKEEIAASSELDKLVDLASQNVATWVERAEATAGDATATHAGETGKSHYVVGVIAGYDAAQIGTVDIIDGGDVKISQPIHNAGVIPLPKPLKITAGSDAAAVLSAGGAGVVGKVNILGFTI